MTTNDVEHQRQALLPTAQQKPMLSRLIDATLTGNGFDDVDLLYAGACIEQIILAGPRALLDAEPDVIADYPGMVAAYRKLLDERLDEATRDR